MVTVSNSLAQMKETISLPRRVRATWLARLLSACLFAACLFVQLPAAAQTQPAPDKQDSPTVSPAPAGPPQITNEPRRPIGVAQRRPAKLAPPVTAVVHRLRGWKLRALVTPPDAPFAAAFDDKFVRMSVVAGYVLPDGRSVVARLPRAEAEMLNVSLAFPEFYDKSTPGGDSGLLLMRQDGAHVPVKFVGFDSATGLSLLEAAEAFITTAQQVVRQESPAVGERVRLVAPLPSAVAEALAATESQARDAAADQKADDQRPVGISGVMYMSLAEIEGRLTGVDRSPAGRAVGLTLQVDRAASPEWAGSVALTETGSLAGIVEQSEGREARLISAEVVCAAAERVKKRRASVPQPWLGARGDAVAGSQMQFFVEHGWPRGQAFELLRRRQGVMLTAIAPGSPAALAGLRPGDVVSRIDNFAVRGVEDMSQLLRETGFDRLAEFTVHRAHESPRSFQVRLSESQNPALETARAEARAVEAETRAAEAAVRSIDEQLRRIDEMVARHNEAVRKAKAEGRAAAAGAGDAEAAKQVDELRRQVAELQARLNGAETEYVRSRKRLEEAKARVQSASGVGAATAFRPLLPFGVKAMLYMTSVEVGGREVSDHGLVVLGVNPESPAARAGLKAGDVIETIDGQLPHALDLSDKPPAELDREPTLAVRRSGQRFSVKVSRPVS